MSLSESRLERAGARLRPVVLLAFMVAVFTKVSGDRLPVEPLELSAHDNPRPAHAPAMLRGSDCPDTEHRPSPRLPTLLTRF